MIKRGSPLALILFGSTVLAQSNFNILENSYMFQDPMTGEVVEGHINTSSSSSPIQFFIRGQIDSVKCPDEFCTRQDKLRLLLDSQEVYNLQFRKSLNLTFDDRSDLQRWGRRVHDGVTIFSIWGYELIAKPDDDELVTVKTAR